MKVHLKTKASKKLEEKAKEEKKKEDPHDAKEIVRANTRPI